MPRTLETTAAIVAIGAVGYVIFSKTDFAEKFAGKTLGFLGDKFEDLMSGSWNFIEAYVTSEQGIEATKNLKHNVQVGGFAAKALSKSKTVSTLGRFAAKIPVFGTPAKIAVKGVSKFVLPFTIADLGATFWETTTGTSIPVLGDGEWLRTKSFWNRYSGESGFGLQAWKNLGHDILEGIDAAIPGYDHTRPADKFGQYPGSNYLGSQYVSPNFQGLYPGDFGFL